MLRDPDALAAVIGLETGLGFEVSSGLDAEGHQCISLVPAGHNPAHTFALKVVIQWRRLQLSFEPGKFAGPLLEAMSQADATGRAAFASVMLDCERHGAKVALSPNGTECRFNDATLWEQPWRRLSFQLTRGNIELGTDEGIPDFDIVRDWSARFAAAIVALLPLEEHEPAELEGFPEGAVKSVEVNRYERDRRNRAAALAIHGSACLACGFDFGRTYGPAAAGYIEVHHIVPVSNLGPDYVIDPKEDLVPLCPNCHAVAHRRNPPFSIGEIKELIGNPGG